MDDTREAMRNAESMGYFADGEETFNLAMSQGRCEAPRRGARDRRASRSRKAIVAFLSRRAVAAI